MELESNAGLAATPVADIVRAKRATIPGKNRASRLRGVEKSDSVGLRREMLLRISAIENMIPTVKRAAAGTCGNRAPETVELFPPGDLGTDAIEASLAVLEAWPALTPSCAAAVMEAATRLFWLAGRIKADVVRQAGAFGCNASKPRSLLGQADIRLLFYYVFADRLAAVAHAAFDWVNGSRRNFALRAGLKLAADIGVKEPIFRVSSILMEAPLP
jgi:hypothetical protein